MRQVSAALRAAIDSGERVVRSIFTVDWDDDGIQPLDDLSHQTSDVQVTQSLESSLPPTVQVVPGVAVAELKATLERGNVFRYDAPVTFRGLTSASGNFTTTITVPRPTTTREGDVVILAVFISSSLGQIGGQFVQYDIIRGTNVEWTFLALRGDGISFNDPAYARVEGLLLARRATANEPTSYTIQVPPDGTALWVGSAVNIGDQNIIGITDVETKGEDEVDTATSVTIPPINVDLPGSMIVAFYAASSYQVSGMGFSPSTSDDVEQVELVTTAPPVSGASNVRMAVMTTAAPPRGRNLKVANITGPAALVATLGFAVVLGPRLAGDEAQHAAWTFSEMNPDSPYAGKTRIRRPTRWDIAFITDDGFERVPLFTGFTVSNTAGSRSRRMEFTALDNRENLRGTKRTMNVVASTLIPEDTLTFLPYMPGLETTWVISKLLIEAFVRSSTSYGVATYEGQHPLRNGMGYFASPLANKFSFLWAPMHGSLHPIAGRVRSAYVQSLSTARRRAEFGPGPFVAATRVQPDGTTTNATWIGETYGYASQLWHPTNGQLGGRMQYWFKRGVGNGLGSVFATDDEIGLSNAYIVESRVAADGTWTLRVTQPSITRTITGPSIPADDTWHFLGVHFDSVNASVTFRLDNTNTVVAMTAWANATPAVLFFNVARMSVGSGAAIAELQIAGSYDPSSGAYVGIKVTDTWANEDFTPTAFIDMTGNLLDCVPSIASDADTFSIIAEISDVELAAFFFDADGFPHYRNSRSNVTTDGQTVQRQITAQRTLKDLTYEASVQQIANIVSASWIPYEQIVNGVAYQASGVIEIAPGEIFTLALVMPGPVAGAATVTTVHANSAPDGTGTNLDGYLSYGVTPGDASLTFFVSNGSAQTMYLVDGSGTPSLIVSATWFAPSSATIAPVTYADITSIRKYGEQPLPPLGGSQWLQREDSAASLALTVLSDLSEVHPVLTNVPIKGDPTLEFGDLVTIVDIHGLGVDGLYRITGKDPKHTPNDGFTQDLVVRQASTIAYWDENSWDDGTVWG